MKLRLRSKSIQILGLASRSFSDRVAQAFATLDMANAKLSQGQLEVSELGEATKQLQKRLGSTSSR